MRFGSILATRSSGCLLYRSKYKTVLSETYTVLLQSLNQMVLGFIV